MSTKYESPSLNNLNLERIFRNCFSLSLNGGLVGGNREVLASYPEPSRYQVGTYRGISPREQNADHCDLAIMTGDEGSLVKLQLQAL